MAQRSWQRAIDQQEYERDLAERRATCTHANDAHIRHVRVVDSGLMDDHATDVVWCNDCQSYLWATTWRTREEVEFERMPRDLARAEAKREREETQRALHRPGRLFA